MYTINIEDSEKLFFTSDTHFGHYNICKYCNRPFATRSEMDKALIENWNAKVPEDGIVIHCGDFMLGHHDTSKEYLKYASNLHGNILLIRGNHDTIPISLEPEGNILAVVDMANIIIGDKKIYASHYPALAFAASYQVFGHIHSLIDGTCSGPDAAIIPLLKPNQYDVGVDHNNFTPISFLELQKKLNK